MSIGTMLFLLVIIVIAFAILDPIFKEIDKRKAEDRLAKKIAKEMQKENTTKKAD